MKTNHGLLLALGAAALATALTGTGAAAQRNRGGGAREQSLPQVTCASGAQPGTQANAAQTALNRTYIPGLPAAQKNGYYQQAYDQANQGITADANNPYNYFLAGEASVGLNNPARADSLFRKTLQLCPEFAAEVTPARTHLGEQAMEMARAALVDRHDTTAAIAAWQLAAQLDSTNADATFYSGYFSYLKGNTAAALPVFRRILAAPAPAATDSNAVQRRDVAVRILLSYGGELFNRDQNADAINLLGAVAVADPNNHDASYWQMLALYKLQRWDDLARLEPKVVQLAPLNYNAYMLAHDAHKLMADRLHAQNNAAQEQQQRLQAMRFQAQGDSLPVQIENVVLSTTGSTSTVRGTVKPGSAAAGSAVRVEFTLSAPAGDVGTGTVNIAAPAAGASTTFELPVTVTDTPTGFRYRLVH